LRPYEVLVHKHRNSDSVGRSRSVSSSEPDNAGLEPGVSKTQHKQKTAGRNPRVRELPNMCEALDSISITAEREKEAEKETQREKNVS
jgi:hypothetical protein